METSISPHQNGTSSAPKWTGSTCRTRLAVDPQGQNDSKANKGFNNLFKMNQQ